MSYPYLGLSSIHAKGKKTKLESRSEFCLFVGYPKGTRGYYFYSTKEKKVFISTNATFLEEDYMKYFKPKSKLVFEELTDDVISPSIEDKIKKAFRKDKSLETQQISDPRRSGRVVRQPERYLEIGESCDQ